MAQYLDKTGLTTLWAKIKNTFALKSHPHSKSEVGLGNVDNTSDANKPVSNATQQALNLKANSNDVYTKSETDNKINEPLYNLGYYDTITANSDGSYTITRQTGYLTYKSGDLGNVATSTSGLIYFNIDLPFNYNYGGFISNIKYTTNPDIAWSSNEDIVVIANTGAVGDRRIYYKEGRTEPIYIQYKLATSYTEKVEKNHYSRYNKTFILEHNKSEAERSANLGYFADRQGRWWVTKQDDISEFINQLPNGTYNISADVTPLSIDSGYNVTSCFFWLQIYGGQYSSGDGIKTVIDNFTSLNQTRRGYLTFTKQSYTNYEFRLWGFGNHNGGNHGEGKCSNIMLVEGDHSYPYQAYNSKAHITNYEADFLKNEAERSANLLDYSKIVNNYTLTSSGQLLSYDGYYVTDFIRVEPYKTYTMSNSHDGTLYFYDINKNFVKVVENTTPVTFTIDSNVYYIRKSSPNTHTKIMINEGSIALPYQAYNQNKHITNNEASFLKTEYDKITNLFDYDNAEWQNDVSLSTQVGNLWNKSGSKVSTFVKVEPNKTYYIQNCALICCYNSNKEYLNQSFYINYYSVNNFSFTTPSNCAYIRIDTEIPITQIMLNEGSTPLPYQPYEGKVVHEKELGDKLGGYVDTSTRQEINALKRFNNGVALKRDDTGIFQTDDGANLAIKSFGRDLHFYGKSGVENYVANAILSFPYSGENNSYVYNFPQKTGTIALTSDFKTINGNSIVGSGDMAITADSVFTEVTDVIDTFTINRNGTWLITCLGYNKIYASDNSSIFFYGSALVSMTSAGSNPHICINGTAYACSSAITFITSGIMQVYKKAN